MDAALFGDEVFRFLAKFTVLENFYARALNQENSFEGVENQKLVACSILREVPGLMRHVKQEIVFVPIKGLDLRQRIVADNNQDGAYVIEKGRLSNKVFLQNFVSDTMRQKGCRTIEELQRKFLPQDFLSSGNAVALDAPIIGGRTQVALAAGLAGGRGYIIKQTTYAGLPVGKVCMFGIDGLSREFFLASDPANLFREQDYFDPARRITGVLRAYSQDKKERQEFRVTPAEMGIKPSQFLERPSFLGSVFERFPMLRSNIAAGLFR